MRTPVLRSCVFPLLVALSLLAVKVRSADLEKQCFKVSNGDRFSIQAPSGRKGEANPPDGAPASTFRLVNSESTSILLISVIPSKPGGDLENMDDLEKLLILGTKPSVRNSEEGKLYPLSFKSGHAYGVYATLTDSRFAPPAVPAKGEYRHSATFILNCSHRAVVATFLTNEERAASVDLSILILKTLRVEAEPK